MIRLISCALVLAVSAGLANKVTAQSLSAEIEETIAAIAAGDSIGTSGEGLQALEFLPALYEGRQYRAVWDDPTNTAALFQGIETAVRHGFRAEDFHQPRLGVLHQLAETGDAEAKAAFDILASDAAALLIHHLLRGKVDAVSLDPRWNFGQPMIDSMTAAEVVNAYIDGEGFSAALDRVIPSGEQYDALVEALAAYRAISDRGGWSPVPEGPALKPGMTDGRVSDLRARLAAEGALTDALPSPELVPAGTDPDHVYTDALATDVMAFQARHGLEADGVLGPKSLTALNRTVEERIDQLRLSLERARWLLLGLDDDFVLVNIAGPTTYLRRNGKTVWETRSITGLPYRKTPVFRDEIEYMEVNPTWTVPPGIMRADKLPAVRRDIGYLARGGYSVRRLSDGQMVHPGSVNWSANNPGVTLVQRPGPDNALGLIKFMFPNDYAVYLHDTNDRSLFDRNERNLSSGCIRVENPFELANLLMEGDPDWSPARLDAILASGKTTRINLPEPMPVLLTYWTAWVENGEVQFREDVYERDAAVLKALNADS